MKPPVYIFQMGKVGSTALSRTLNHFGCPAMQAHTLQMFPEDRKIELKRRLWMAAWGLDKVKVICPVREPVGRNVSAFFENLRRDVGEGVVSEESSLADVRQLFLDRARHNVPIEWFDENLRTVFGVDVFQRPFPVERRWDAWRSRGVEILVYRTDLSADEQLKIVSEFVGKALTEWIRANEGSSKAYAGVYERFRSEVRLPRHYVRMLCESRFCRHFWSADEIDGIVQRWSEPVGNG